MTFAVDWALKTNDLSIYLVVLASQVGVHTVGESGLCCRVLHALVYVVNQNNINFEPFFKSNIIQGENISETRKWRA